jgi:voltage-gated potassium channel
MDKKQKKPISTRRLITSATDTLLELAFIYFTILAVAAALFSIFEHHSFFDSLYWAGTTATSTGYGDISPKTKFGELLALFLMHISIFVIAPLIVVKLVDRIDTDKDKFTEEEQQAIMHQLAILDKRLHKIDQLMLKLAQLELAKAQACDGDGRR